MLIRDISFKRHIKKIVISVITVIILITLGIFTGIFSILKQVLFYPLYLFSIIGSGIHYNFNTIVNLSKLSSENTVLKKGLKQLEVKMLSFEGLEAENIRLRKLLDLPLIRELGKIYGVIIAHSPDSWHNQVIINIGGAKGVKINTPVINEAGLIGKVISFSHSTSTVQLLSDSKSAVSCKDTRSRDIGIITGGFLNTGKLRYLQQFADIKEQDILITSGLGGIYPQDIPVGRVLKLQKTSGELVLDVDVAFMADFNRLEEVVALVQK